MHLKIDDYNYIIQKIMKVKMRSGVMFVKTEYFGQRTRGRPRRCEVTAFKKNLKNDTVVFKIKTV